MITLLAALLLPSPAHACMGTSALGGIITAPEDGAADVPVDAQILAMADGAEFGDWDQVLEVEVLLDGSPIAGDSEARTELDDLDWISRGLVTFSPESDLTPGALYEIVVYDSEGAERSRSQFTAGGAAASPVDAPLVEIIEVEDHGDGGCGVPGGWVALEAPLAASATEPGAVLFWRVDADHQGTPSGDPWLTATVRVGDEAVYIETSYEGPEEREECFVAVAVDAAGGWSEPSEVTCTEVDRVGLGCANVGASTLGWAALSLALLGLGRRRRALAPATARR
jgi:hypothetical protein